MLFFEKLRQLTYPREFRIPQPLLKGNLENLEKLLDEILKKLSSDDDLPTSDDNNRFLADVATGLWRLRSKMINPDTGQPLEEMGRPFRHLVSVWDALAQAGIEIIDHTNEPFDIGISIKVISFQQTPELEREMIIETIKPTIYNKDIKIQIGEVIVGKPENDN